MEHCRPEAYVIFARYMDQREHDPTSILEEDGYGHDLERVTREAGINLVSDRPTPNTPEV